ncbi:tRNA 2-selenouridine(34) synthase MnmH [Oceanobacter mangrovi]|uniref:tRNA 2-selenouridine(34) synthase MnmH n=1 Tax=Oceanobacter mangrovi TaxID=2862510 RepID=UPI001C8E4AB9|nr:tRNA 2-selenouridine(34) synthase MnmH [Oceanobacter mangrovi]
MTDQRRPDAKEFLDIFLNDIPLIDTRAPIEFRKGAFPTSTSLPLMTDSERAKVGTCYKNQGQEEAIKLGHSLVKGEIKEQRVNAWIDFAHQHPQGYLYCWRGGLRSQICQQWMHEAGCDYPRITGGYKAMRTWVLEQFQRHCDDMPKIVLAGKTGCNKTGLLNALDNSIDLEGLANHLGSAFGKRPDGQPSQLDFENALGVAMIKADHSAAGQNGQRIVFEDESMLIGRCALPHEFRASLNQSPVVLLETTLEERIEHSYNNYILAKLADWQQQVGEEEAFARFAHDLTDSLKRVQKRLGGVRYQQLAMQMEEALSAHQMGNPELHRGWITALLVDYYDPMYEYQLSKKLDRVVFRGNREEVREYLTAVKA